MTTPFTDVLPVQVEKYRDVFVKACEQVVCHVLTYTSNRILSDC